MILPANGEGSSVQVIGVLYAIGAIGGRHNFVWGIGPEIVSALNAIFLPVLLYIPLPVFTVLAGKMVGGNPVPHPLHTLEPSNLERDLVGELLEFTRF